MTDHVGAITLTIMRLSQSQKLLATVFHLKKIVVAITRTVLLTTIFHQVIMKENSAHNHCVSSPTEWGTNERKNKTNKKQG